MPRSIAIVGAGIAGLSCARRLADAQLRVRLFDKGRSVGGRMATRRVETPVGQVRLDHGAQHFTVRSAAFDTAMASLVASGAVVPWPEDGQAVSPHERRWVGAPSMSAVGRALADGLDVTSSAKVMGVQPDGVGWRLELGDEWQTKSEGPFDAVVVAVPAEQAAPLVAGVAPRISEAAESARTAPCWAGLYVFDRSVGEEFPAALSDGVLSWASCQRRLPGRPEIEAWVLHASSSWSEANLELAPEQASESMLNAFREYAPMAPAPIWSQAHRWRYARVERPAPAPFYWDSDLGVGACGDWCLGPRIEAAWQSGRQLADQILSGL